MNPVLEEILRCPNLPSLPAVAVRVIELTSDVNVSLPELARTIQNDQGLSAKVLKTVNSSFYGLRQRVASIDKALVMLGLSPVKSLALGFSLVSAVKPNASSGFDFVSYWRRGLYTGMSAKLIADAAGFKFADEAFLGGLLQDVGMIAMHQALGDRYTHTMAMAGKNHRELVRHELAEFDLQHPDVGAMLVKRWRLPDELVMPVKYHERPSAAPASCVDHVRCVGLGNLVHDILATDDPLTNLKRLYDKASAWYKLNTDTVDELVKRASDGAKTMAQLFSLDIGSEIDAERIIETAGRRAVELAKSSPASSSALAGATGSVLAKAEFDPLTGAVGRIGFDTAVRHGFGVSAGEDAPMSVLQIMIDNYEHLVSAHGQDAGIEAVVGVTALLKRAYEPHGGVVCRLADAAFAVVAPGLDRAAAVRVADEFREELGHLARSWGAGGAALPVTTSIGVASLEPDTRGTLKEPDHLVLACARALQASRAAGGGCTRAFVPKAAA